MLDQQVPVGVVFVVIVVRNCKLYSPLVHIVVLEMPMDSNGAHVVGAFNNFNRVVLIGP